MRNLQEVPTEELLSFQDYPTVHNINSNITIPLSETQINIGDKKNFEHSPTLQPITVDNNSSGIF